MVGEVTDIPNTQRTTLGTNVAVGKQSRNGPGSSAKEREATHEVRPGSRQPWKEPRIPCWGGAGNGKKVPTLLPATQRPAPTAATDLSPGQPASQAQPAKALATDPAPNFQANGVSISLQRRENYEGGRKTNKQTNSLDRTAGRRGGDTRAQRFPFHMVRQVPRTRNRSVPPMQKVNSFTSHPDDWGHTDPPVWHRPQSSCLSALLALPS